MMFAVCGEGKRILGRGEIDICHVRVTRFAKQAEGLSLNA